MILIGSHRILHIQVPQMVMDFIFTYTGKLAAPSAPILLSISSRDVRRVPLMTETSASPLSIVTSFPALFNRGVHLLWCFFAFFPGKHTRKKPFSLFLYSLLNSGPALPWSSSSHPYTATLHTYRAKEKVMSQNSKILGKNCKSGTEFWKLYSWKSNMFFKWKWDTYGQF